MSRVDRYLEDLLAQRRPRRFAATDAEAARLRAGIELRAAQPGAADPDPAFIAALGQRLATAATADPATANDAITTDAPATTNDSAAANEAITTNGSPTTSDSATNNDSAATNDAAETTDQATTDEADTTNPADTTDADATADVVAPDGRRRSRPERSPSRTNRRRFTRVAAVAVGSAAVAVAVDRLVGSGSQQSPDETAQPTLVPDDGAWQTVLAAEQLPVGAVHAFELGGVAGFVVRTADGLRAVSATCTHLGCRLVFQAAARELACPCHNAVFALTGSVLRYQLPVELTPLPLIPVRESAAGAIQVLVPPT